MKAAELWGIARWLEASDRRDADLRGRRPLTREVMAERLAALLAFLNAG